MIFFLLIKKIKNKTTEAIPNLAAIKSIDEISWRHSLTITKVAPHNNVIKSKALSEVRREGFFSGVLFIGLIVSKTFEHVGIRTPFFSNLN